MPSMLFGNTSDVQLPYRHTVKRVALLIGLVTVLNLVMLAGTALFKLYYRSIGRNWEAGSSIKYLLVQFDLASENVLASWYSSLLLLLVAVVALICFVVDRNQLKAKRARLLAFGWVPFAFAFLMLSLDEAGSLHERLGMLSVLNPFGDFALGWVDLFVVPIGVAAIFIAAFGWFHIGRNRRAFAFMLVGILLLATIPFQEKIEVWLWHSAVDRDNWQRPVWHIFFEEGAELFGIQSILIATLLYLNEAVKRVGGSEWANGHQIMLRFRRVVGLGGVVGLGAFFIVGNFAWTIAAPYLTEGDSGLVQNWFPGALAFLAALICFYVADTVETLRPFYVLWGLLLLFLCVYYGANGQGWLWGGPRAVLRYMINGGVAATAVLLTVLIAWQKQFSWLGWGLILWALSLALALSSGSSYAEPLDFAAGVILFLLLSVDLYQYQAGTQNVQRTELYQQGVPK